jgi:hypothetical protein
VISFFVLFVCLCAVFAFVSLHARKICFRCGVISDYFESWKLWTKFHEQGGRRGCEFFKPISLEVTKLRGFCLILILKTETQAERCRTEER